MSVFWGLHGLFLLEASCLVSGRVIFKNVQEKCRKPVHFEGGRHPLCVFRVDFEMSRGQASTTLKSNMWFFGAFITFIPEILVKKMIQAWDHLIRECWEPIFSPSFCLFACRASTLFVRKSFGVPQSGATKKNEKIKDYELRVNGFVVEQRCFWGFFSFSVSLIPRNILLTVNCQRTVPLQWGAIPTQFQREISGCCLRVPPKGWTTWSDPMLDF